MSGSKYLAFITYAHADKRVAAWLQRTLESYRLPSHIAHAGRGRRSRSRRLGRIFRDREELSAGGELGTTLREALKASEFLIVVCSPSAAKSRWVNEEIREFGNLHGNGNILCLIAESPPDGAGLLGGCFPPALGYAQDTSRGLAGHEPVAADLRTEGDGRTLAKLKIISALLRVPLDELVQRDAQRRNRRLLGLSAASAAGMLVTGTLALVAIDARTREQQRRAEAEDLIEFMLGDLRNRLDAVGRLDVLDAVGEKATAYYANTELNEHSTASLGRRARAFLLLGEVDDLRGDLTAARSAFERAHKTTSELVARSPEDGAVLFDHAQSTFWVGYLAWRVGEFDKAEHAFGEYLELARRLLALDSKNPAWVVESGHAHYNLGVLSLQRGRADDAIGHLNRALEAFNRAIATQQAETEWSWSLAQTHAWLADAHELRGALDQAIAGRTDEAAIYQSLLQDDPGNQDLRLSILNATLRHADLLVQRGKLDGALERLDGAQGIAEELRQLDPENTLVQHLAAAVIAGIAEIEFFKGQRIRSLQLLQEGESIATSLVARDSSVLEWALLLHQIQLQSIRYRTGMGEADLSGVLLRLEHINDELASLAAHSADNVDLTALQAESQLSLAETHLLAGSIDSATLCAENVVRTLIPLREGLPPRSLAILAIASRLLDNLELAGELDSELASMGYRHPYYVNRRG